MIACDCTYRKVKYYYHFMDILKHQNPYQGNSHKSIANIQSIMRNPNEDDAPKRMKKK